RNPMQPEYPVLRRSLVGSLLRARRNNVDASRRAVKLFEVGTAYLPRPGEQPLERTQLGLITESGFLALKGVVETVARTLGLAPRVTFGAGDQPFLGDE